MWSEINDTQTLLEISFGAFLSALHLLSSKSLAEAQSTGQMEVNESGDEGGGDERQQAKSDTNVAEPRLMRR